MQPSIGKQGALAGTLWAWLRRIPHHMSRFDRRGRLFADLSSGLGFGSLTERLEAGTAN